VSDVIDHFRARTLSVSGLQSVDDRCVIFFRGVWPAWDAAVELARDVLDEQRQYPPEFSRPSRAVEGLVKLVVELLESPGVTAVRRGDDSLVRGDNTGEVPRGGIGGSPGGDLASNQRLSGEELTDVVAGELGNYESAVRLESQETLDSERLECLTSRSGRDPKSLGKTLDPHKITGQQLTRHDLCAHV